MTPFNDQSKTGRDEDPGRQDRADPGGPSYDCYNCPKLGPRNNEIMSSRASLADLWALEAEVALGPEPVSGSTPCLFSPGFGSSRPHICGADVLSRMTFCISLAI